MRSNRRKNVIIAYDRPRELAKFKDYDSFAIAHHRWVQAALEAIDAKREGWTESIAVGSSPFIERIKNAMGVMAKGRSVQPTEGHLSCGKRNPPIMRFLSPKIATLASNRSVF